MGFAVKIVMQWDIDGGYECGLYTNTVCFVYESTEACIIHFEDILKATKEKCEKQRLEISNWHKSMPRQDNRRMQADTAYKMWMDKKPVEGASSEFVFAGHIFEYSWFLYSKELILPEIYELNEWFDLKSGEEI